MFLLGLSVRAKNRSESCYTLFRFMFCFWCDLSGRYLKLDERYPDVFFSVIVSLLDIFASDTFCLSGTMRNVYVFFMLCLSDSRSNWMRSLSFNGSHSNDIRNCPIKNNFPSFTIQWKLSLTKIYYSLVLLPLPVLPEIL